MPSISLDNQFDRNTLKNTILEHYFYLILFRIRQRFLNKTFFLSSTHFCTLLNGIGAIEKKVSKFLFFRKVVSFATDCETNHWFPFSILLVSDLNAVLSLIAAFLAVIILRILYFSRFDFISSSSLVTNKFSF